VAVNATLNDIQRTVDALGRRIAKPLAKMTKYVQMLDQNKAGLDLLAEQAELIDPGDLTGTIAHIARVNRCIGGLRARLVKDLEELEQLSVELSELAVPPCDLGEKHFGQWRRSLWPSPKQFRNGHGRNEPLLRAVLARYREYHHR
jgi:hypothetical protein